MGYEAYRLRTRFDTKNFDDLKNAILNFGAIITTDSPIISNDIRNQTMEFKNENGVIELWLSTIKRNDLLGEESEILGDVILHIQIAKPNSVQIITDLQNMLFVLNDDHHIVTIYDYLLKKEIDLYDFSEISTSYLTVKKEFEKFFGVQKYPLRCREVKLRKERN